MWGETGAPGAAVVAVSAGFPYHGSARAHGRRLEKQAFFRHRVKRRQEKPKRRPRGAKRLPRGAQEAPRGAQEAPRRRQEAQEKKTSREEKTGISAAPSASKLGFLQKADPSICAFRSQLAQVLLCFCGISESVFLLTVSLDNGVTVRSFFRRTLLFLFKRGRRNIGYPPWTLGNFKWLVLAFLRSVRNQKQDGIV